MRKRLYKLFGLVIVALVLPTIPSYSACFRLSGSISCTNYNPDGSVRQMRNLSSAVQTNGTTVAFTLDVGEQGWRIEKNFSEKHSEVVSYDGTNVYDVLYDYTSRQTGPVFAVLAKEPYPLDSDGYTTVAWIAFASSSYLKTTNTLPALWLFPRLDAEAYAFQAETIQAQAEPRLPLSLRFIASASSKANSLRINYLDQDRENALTEEDIVKAQSAIPNGFLGAEYTVLSRTNCGGLEFPLEFVLRRFSWSYKHKFPQSKGLLEVFHGRLTAVKPSAGNIFVPATPSNVEICDKRFRNQARRIDYIHYSWTNSSWPEKSDPKLVSLYQSQSGFKRQAQYWIVRLIKHPKEAKRLLFTLLSAGAVLLVFFVLVIRRAGASAAAKQA